MSDTQDTSDRNPGYEPSDPIEDARHSLHGYVSDLIALIKHTQIPLDRQVSVGIEAGDQEALLVLNDIRRTLDLQRQALEAQLLSLGGDGDESIKSAWTALLGAGAAAVNSMRTFRVSRALRDDYTALSLALISYTMLNAFAVTIANAPIATLAQTHRDQIAPLLERIAAVMPGVIAREASDERLHNAARTVS